MKWLVLFLLSIGLLVSAQPKQCLLSDFYGLSWIGEPTMRHMELSRWITTNGDSCTSDQLVVLWNNLAGWAGVADSAEMRAKVLYYYARARERENKK
jgi:hypothetical protein